MSDNLEFLPKPENSLEFLVVEPTSNSKHDADQEKTVTLELPVDVIAALDQYIDRSGRSQTQSILDALRSALGLDQALDQITSASDNAESSAADTEDSKTSIPETVISETATQITLDALIAEIECLKRRVHLLEPLIPKVEDLVGKSIAF